MHDTALHAWDDLYLVRICQSVVYADPAADVARAMGAVLVGLIMIFARRMTQSLYSLGHGTKDNHNQ